MVRGPTAFDTCMLALGAGFGKGKAPKDFNAQFECLLISRDSLYDKSCS